MNNGFYITHISQSYCSLWTNMSCERHAYNCMMIRL